MIISFKWLPYHLEKLWFIHLSGSFWQIFFFLSPSLFDGEEWLFVFIADFRALFYEFADPFLYILMLFELHVKILLMPLASILFTSYDKSKTLKLFSFYFKSIKLYICTLLLFRPSSSSVFTFFICYPSIKGSSVSIVLKCWMSSLPCLSPLRMSICLELGIWYWLLAWLRRLMWSW